MSNKSLMEVGSYLLHHNQTVAVSESVTSGNLQATLSLADNAMKFFQGGITTYNLGQKSRHLAVDPIHALSCNCVSETVAIQMARSVVNLFSSHWGLAITGYASPDPQQGIDHLFAFYAIAKGDQIKKSGKISCDKMEPEKARHYYSDQVIELFSRLLTSGKA